MFWDNLRKVLAGPTLWRLNGIISVKLVPILFALGLLAIGLWAVDHLFLSFSFNFGQGIWGILEILVYGPLWVIALRILCELVLVYFKANDIAAGQVNRARGNNSLSEDVRDALHDLADDNGAAGATDVTP